MTDIPRPDPVAVTRRRLLKNAAGLAAATTVASAFSSCSTAQGAAGRPITRGRIRQSIAQWCFAEHWNLDELCRVAVDLGCRSVELVGPDAWPTLEKYGLTCAIAPNGMPDPPFVKGFNNPAYHEQILSVTRKTIDQCADFGIPTVIAFTGYKWRTADDPSSGEIPPDEGAANCVKGLKELCRHAEKKQVNVAIEILNTRASDHPMKGHPGYQGDHTDYVMDIVERVGSPNMKILFDIYHVQIMDGDVIRRLRQYKDYLGHVHTAGNPGRKELDEAQELNYRAIMLALAELDYQGFVGHEFIPTGDPLRGLRQACALCDV
jgi:hydroxypyruvate isomerase